MSFANIQVTSSPTSSPTQTPVPLYNSTGYIIIIVVIAFLLTSVIAYKLREKKKQISVDM